MIQTVLFSLSWWSSNYPLIRLKYFTLPKLASNMDTDLIEDGIQKMEKHKKQDYLKFLNLESWFSIEIKIQEAEIKNQK